MLLSNVTASTSACAALLNLKISVLPDVNSPLGIFPVDSRSGTCSQPVPYPDGEPKDVLAFPLLIDAFVKAARVTDGEDREKRLFKGDLHFLASVFANLTTVGCLALLLLWINSKRCVRFLLDVPSSSCRDHLIHSKTTWSSNILFQSSSHSPNIRIPSDEAASLPRSSEHPFVLRSLFWSLTFTAETVHSRHLHTAYCLPKTQKRSRFSLQRWWRQGSMCSHTFCSPLLAQRSSTLRYACVAGTMFFEPQDTHSDYAFRIKRSFLRHYSSFLPPNSAKRIPRSVLRTLKHSFYSVRRTGAAITSARTVYTKWCGLCTRTSKLKGYDCL